MSWLSRYLDLLERRHKWLLALLALISLLMLASASRLQTNATPYFLDLQHPSRQADQYLKAHFTGSGENLMIATLTREATIFNPRSLQELHRLTLALEQLTLTTANDNQRLDALLARLPADQRPALRFGSPLQPRELDGVQALQRALAQARLLQAADERYLRELAVRIHPITKVRSLVRIESITAAGDELDIHPLMYRVPQDDAGIRRLEQEARSNGLLRHIMFSAGDPRAVNTLVELSIPQDDAPAMRQLYDAVAGLIERLHLTDSYHLGGPPAIFAQTSATMEQDSNTFFPLIIVVAMLLLGLLFRTLRSALVPVAVAFLAVIWTLGTMAALGYAQNIVSTMLPVFLISIGVSDSIHFLAAYRRAQAHSADDRAKPVASVLAQLWRPMLMTSLTTMGGFLSLTWTPIHFIQQFGLFVALGVGYALVITLSLLPALLLWLPAERRPARGHPAWIGRLADWNLQLALRHPRAIALLGLLLLGLCAAGMARLQIDNEMIRYFAADTRVRQDNQVFKQHFGGAATLEFVLRAPETGYFKQESAIGALERIQARLLERPEVGAVYGLPNFLKLMNKAMQGDDPAAYQLPAGNPALYPQYLFLYESSNGDEIFNVVDADYRQARLVLFVKSDQTSVMDGLVKAITPVMHTELPGVEIMPAGFGEVLIATRDAIIYSQLSSLLLSLISVFALLLLLLRSLRYALIGLVPLVMVVLGNFALLGWSGLYLDVGTAIVAPIAIGISVDYAIYFLTSCQRHAGSNRAAVAEALRLHLGPILFNTLVLGAGFLVLTLSSHQALINLGWLVTSTMLFSALATFLLLPPLLLWLRRPPTSDAVPAPGVLSAASPMQPSTF